MQSVPITIQVVSSNPTHSEVYSIQHYVIKVFSFSCTICYMIELHIQCMSTCWHNTSIKYVNIKNLSKLKCDKFKIIPGSKSFPKLSSDVVSDDLRFTWTCALTLLIRSDTFGWVVFRWSRNLSKSLSSILCSLHNTWRFLSPCVSFDYVNWNIQR